MAHPERGFGQTVPFRYIPPTLVKDAQQNVVIPVKIRPVPKVLSSAADAPLVAQIASGTRRFLSFCALAEHMRAGECVIAGGCIVKGKSPKNKERSFARAYRERQQSPCRLPHTAMLFYVFLSHFRKRRRISSSSATSSLSSLRTSGSNSPSKPRLSGEATSPAYAFSGAR